MRYWEKLFLAVQQTTVPVSQRFTHTQIEESFQLVKEVLVTKPPATKCKLFACLFLIDLLSLIFHQKRFPALNQQKRHALLLTLFDSRWPIIRKGFWGLNTLTRLGVYGQPSVYPWIHYHLKEIPVERKNS